MRGGRGTIDVTARQTLKVKHDGEVDLSWWLVCLLVLSVQQYNTPELFRNFKGELCYT